MHLTVLPIVPLPHLLLQADQEPVDQVQQPVAAATEVENPRIKMKVKKTNNSSLIFLDILRVNLSMNLE